MIEGNMSDIRHFLNNDNYKIRFAEYWFSTKTIIFSIDNVDTGENILMYIKNAEDISLCLEYIKSHNLKDKKILESFNETTN